MMLFANSAVIAAVGLTLNFTAEPAKFSFLDLFLQFVFCHLFGFCMKGQP